MSLFCVSAAVGVALLNPSAAFGARAAVGAPTALRVSARPLMSDVATSISWTPSSRGEPGLSPRDLAFGSLGEVAKYCEDLNVVTRRKTRTVTAGPVKFGSDHPLVRQTMATTLTSDVPASVDQIMRCADEGFDLVRLTVVGMKDAKAMVEIRATLDAKGYDIPLCADMHFAPKVGLYSSSQPRDLSPRTPPPPPAALTPPPPPLCRWPWWWRTPPRRSGSTRATLWTEGRRLTKWSMTLTTRRAPGQS